MHGPGFEPGKALSQQALNLPPLAAWLPVRMHGPGFEPGKALSQQVLSLPPLAAWLPVQ